MARAVYSSAEILLLDDVLAALDVHTYALYLLSCSEVPDTICSAKAVVENCLKGDLIRGRTVLLVVGKLKIFIDTTLNTITCRHTM